MTRYYLINNASTAAAYGIGTHLRYFLKSLESQKDLQIVFVDLQCNTHSNCRSSQDASGNWHLQIPTVTAGIEDVAYNRNIFAEIVQWDETQSAKAQRVFHFHYEQHALLAHLLKAYFSESRVFFTVHYQTWGFLLQGNRKQLQQYLAYDQQSTLPEDQRQNCLLIQQSVARERRMFSIADEIIVLSEFTRQVLIEDYKVTASKLSTIPNAIDDRRRGQKVVLDDAKKYILYVGRLDTGKGILPLISAFKQVKIAVPQAHLIMVGNGDYDICLSRVGELWSDISWTGRVDSQYLDKLYRSVHIGVLPSFNEQCSYSVIEMLMHGLPVVGTDCSGVGEMLEHAPELRVAFEGARGDESQMSKLLAETLITLLKDEERYKIERLNSRVAYENKYSLALATQRWITLLKKPRRLIQDNEDLLRMFDEQVLHIINQRPDYIDLDFFGLAGIAHYLWWRGSQLACGEQENIKLSLMLREHLIYAIDWMEEMVIAEASTASCDRPYLRRLLSELLQHAVYPSKLARLLTYIQHNEERDLASVERILSNILRICNYK